MHLLLSWTSLAAKACSDVLNSKVNAPTNPHVLVSLLLLRNLQIESSYEHSNSDCLRNQGSFEQVVLHVHRSSLRQSRIFSVHANFACCFYFRRQDCRFSRLSLKTTEIKFSLTDGCPPWGDFLLSCFHSKQGQLSEKVTFQSCGWFLIESFVKRIRLLRSQ